jgi:O-antigen ligase
MASDVLLAPPRVRVETWIAETAFVLFLLLVFVSLTPFMARDQTLLAMGEVGGAGDALRQVSYIAVFSVIALCAYRKFGAEMISLVPLLLGLMLLWCLLSAAWADAPGVVVRRAGLQMVIVLSAIWSVETIGIERAMVLLRWLLIGVLLVDWISIPLTVRAIHDYGEPDPALVGAWRGLYFHKNIAGAVSAISTLLFLFFALDQRRRSDWFFCLAALVFTVMTKSKSSLGLLVPAVLAWSFYRYAWKNNFARAVAAIAALLVSCIAITLAFSDWDTIVAFFSDPQELTGRTEVWKAEFAFFLDHALLGSGFGTFTNTGGVSPLHNYVSGAWIEAIAHGHNGYLQLLVETGLIGFGLAVGGLVIQPLVTFWRSDAAPVPFKAFLFGLFVFLILHNMVESDFFQSDGPAWITILMIVAMLRQARAISDSEPQAGEGAAW